MTKHSVFFTGLSRADEAEIVALFDQARGRLPQTWRQAPEADAEVIVIDMDSIYGQMTLMKALDSDKVLVALTSGAHASTDFLLRRPVTAESMQELLRSIAERPAAPAKAAPEPEPESAPAAEATPAPAAAPVVPAPAPAPPPVAAAVAAAPTPEPVVAAAEPEPEPEPVPQVPVAAPAPTHEPRLADYLRPGAFAGTVKAQLPGAPALLLDAASQTYVGGTALKPLLPYCTAVLHNSDLVPADSAEFSALAAKQGGAQPFGRLVWLCALVRGGGSLAPGHDINGSYKLNKWPQTEREFPKHFRIATLMLKGPAKLTEIAEQTGASLAEVIDFVNANLATGYASAG